MITKEDTVNQTTFTDHNGHVQIMQFNSFGNTICIQDGEGRAQYAQYTVNNPGTTGKANQLRLSSKLQNTVANVVENSSFENSSLTWYPTMSSLATVSIASGQAYLGSKALKVTRSTAGTQSAGAYTFVNMDPGETYTYSAYIKTGTYDNYHNVKTATTTEGQVYSFEYDTYGNNTKVSIGSGSTKISSSAAYAGNGNYLSSTTDAQGKVTYYGYDPNTNVLDWVKYPEDTDATRTNYSYDDDMYRLTSAQATTDTGTALTASYTYTNDNLTAIQTGSTNYSFTYGNFSLRTAVKVGNYTLASYYYTNDTDPNDRNFYLEKLEYGNKDSVQYTYDDYGRVTLQTYEDGATVAYKYDNNGALATVTDSATGRTTTYYYDFTERLMKQVETGSGYSHSVGYTYDDINNLTAIAETINGYTRETSYAYDRDNRVTYAESTPFLPDDTDDTGPASIRNYTYDALGRNSQQQTKHGTTLVKTDGYTFTTAGSQISKHTVTAGGSTRNYTYTYDDNGNILSVSDGTNTTTYVYDSANQLTRENNQKAGKTWTWSYDNAGNIRTHKEYAYTTGTVGTATDTVNYTYGNSSWKDLLTVYDGKSITYETSPSGGTVGNMASDGTWTYTWRHGRQLATMTPKTGSAWNFTYDADGLRTKRTNGSTTYSYIYNGDKLSQMTVGSDTLKFAYDASGTPLSVEYNGTTYYYVTNIQGDVTSIVNTSGTTVVEYTYDAWGTLLSTTGSMATSLGEDNPLRYRGYIYDQETALYYLQSRYYNPHLGRFINADAFVATGQGLLGTNMFAYCNNNPINCIDSAGSRCVAINTLGEGVKPDPASPVNGQSTAEKITMLIVETTYAVIAGIDAEIAAGFGFGGTIDTTIFGVDAGVDLFATTRYALVVDDGMVDFMCITSYSAGLSVLDYLGGGAAAGVAHSFFDPQCTCHINSSPYEMMTCEANEPFYDASTSLGASVGAYFVVGGEVSIGYDMKTFAEQAMQVYEKIF